jgi:hypothetical protein
LVFAQVDLLVEDVLEHLHVPLEKGFELGFLLGIEPNRSLGFCILSEDDLQNLSSTQVLSSPFGRVARFFRSV